VADGTVGLGEALPGLVAFVAGGSGHYVWNGFLLDGLGGVGDVGGDVGEGALVVEGYRISLAEWES
jgi:hypothetical protein